MKKHAPVDKSQNGSSFQKTSNQKLLKVKTLTLFDCFKLNKSTPKISSKRLAISKQKCDQDEVLYNEKLEIVDNYHLEKLFQFVSPVIKRAKTFLSETNVSPSFSAPADDTFFLKPFIVRLIAKYLQRKGNYLIIPNESKLRPDDISIFSELDSTKEIMLTYNPSNSSEVLI